MLENPQRLAAELDLLLNWTSSQIRQSRPRSLNPDAYGETRNRPWQKEPANPSIQKRRRSDKRDDDVSVDIEIRMERPRNQIEN